MAVTKDAVSSTSGLSVTGLTLSSFTVASNPNRCLILCCGNAASGGGLLMSGYTWNGSSAGFVEDYDAAAGSFHRIAVAHLVNPDAVTASAAYAIDGGTADEAFLAVLSYYNVDQTTPMGTVRSNTAAASPAWVSCDSIADAVSLAFLWCNATVATAVDGIPEYMAVGTASQSAGATSLTPTGAPAGRILGDLEFCSIATENNATISVSGSGWTQVGSTVIQDATWQEALFYRQYDGTNVDPAFSWSGSVGCSARRWLMRDTAASGTLFGFHATNTGATSTHSITGQNATGNDSLVMYLSHAEANTALGADADYTERFDAGSATGPYRLVVGTRDQATSGAGAANFSATGANASWVMRLLELFHAAAGDQTQETEIENIGGFDTGRVDSEAGDTYNTFGWTLTTPGNGGAVAFALLPAAPAVDAWLPPLVMAPAVPAGWSGR